VGGSLCVGRTRRASPEVARTFRCNGVIVAKIDSSAHFAVPYNDDDVQQVVASLRDEGSVVLLYGARQAGKTSFGTHVCDALKLTGRSVLRISLEGIINRFRDEESALLAFTEQLHAAAGIVAAASSSPSESMNPALWATRAFRSKSLIVMVDEFDSLLSAPGGQDVVDSFLHWLRSVLGKDSWLGGLLLVGSNATLSVKTTPRDGLSDWNVANKLAMPRLDHDDLRGVFKEFTDERGCPAVPDDVINAILDATGGHKGWCMLAGKCLDAALEDVSKHPSTTAPLDMGVLWTSDAHVRFCSALVQLESCTSMVRRVEAMTRDDAMKLLGIVAHACHMLGDDVEARARADAAAAAQWTGWSFATLSGDVGQFLLKYSVFDMVARPDIRVVMGAPHMVSAAEEAADRVVERLSATLNRSLTSVRSQPMDVVLPAMVNAAFADAMQMFRNGAYITASDFDHARLPAEVCYTVALHAVARAWLGRLNVSLETRVNTDTMRRADLILHRGNDVHVVEIVSHVRTGASRGGKADSASVLGHLNRLRTQYAQFREGAKLWLVNFDRVHEDVSGGGAVRGAGHGTHSKVGLFTSGTWTNKDGVSYSCEVKGISCMNVLLSDDLSAIDNVALWTVPRRDAPVVWRGGDADTATCVAAVSDESSATTSKKNKKKKKKKKGV
jgi:hypothetical protein